MRWARPHLTRLAIFALVAAVLPVLAVDGHDPAEHLASGFEDGSVFLSSHEGAIRTLHVEPVTEVTTSRCLGCLLPKKEKGAVPAVLIATAPIALGARPAAPAEAGAPRSGHSPQAPRAPPVS